MIRTYEQTDPEIANICSELEPYLELALMCELHAKTESEQVRNALAVACKTSAKALGLITLND